MRVRRETRRRPSEIYTDYGLEQPGWLLLQGCHIDDETVLHVAFQQAFVGFVDLLHPDQFDIRGNAVIGAEIQHLLGLPNPPDPGTGQLVPSKNETERRDGQRHRRCSYQRQRSVSDRKSTRLNSSHSQISYAVFCLKKKKNKD